MVSCAVHGTFMSVTREVKFGGGKGEGVWEVTFLIIHRKYKAPLKLRTVCLDSLLCVTLYYSDAKEALHVALTVLQITKCCTTTLN